MYIGSGYIVNDQKIVGKYGIGLYLVKSQNITISCGS